MPVSFPAMRPQFIVVLIFAALAPVASSRALGWGGPAVEAVHGAQGATEPAACEDLSSVPVRYDIQYSMDDWPFGTDPASVTTIFEDVLNVGGGCTGCHNGDALADGGQLRLNQPSSVLRLVYAPSYRNFDILRVDPERPDLSLLYGMLNCEPPPTYPMMPPSMSGARIDIGLRAAVFDWIRAGARGRDQDGNLASDVLFRDQVESERFQQFLPEPPPTP